MRDQKVGPTTASALEDILKVESGTLREIDEAQLNARDVLARAQVKVPTITAEIEQRTRRTAAEKTHDIETKTQQKIEELQRQGTQACDEMAKHIARHFDEAVAYAVSQTVAPDADGRDSQC